MAIDGVKLIDLCAHADDRGSLTEIYREQWFGERAVQLNYVRSAAGVLRGVHGHFLHQDYLVLLAGSASVGLKDMRPDSPTLGEAALIELRADRLQTLSVPNGVAHGFYFSEPSTLVYAVTHYWDQDDELGCRWDDPGLGITWPCTSPQISSRDAALPGYPVFAAQLQDRLAGKLTMSAEA
jgi:dTDP-4-dehydrorhamnose 3,5-epimerase